MIAGAVCLSIGVLIGLAIGARKLAANEKEWQSYMDAVNKSWDHEVKQLVLQRHPVYTRRGESYPEGRVPRPDYLRPVH